LLKLLVAIRVLTLEKMPFVLWEVPAGGTELGAMVWVEFKSTEQELVMDEETQIWGAPVLCFGE